MAAKSALIVGSGVAGATIAKGLLARSDVSKVVMFEAGGAFEMRNYRRWIDFVTTGIEPHEPFRDHRADYETAADVLRLEESRLFVRGGSTIHWGGWALRFKPEDFALNTAAGKEIDWPFEYDEIEPFYHQAELSLVIAGDSDNDDPPRKGKRYPLEAPPYCQADGPLVRALEAMKISYAHLPIARNANCMTTGTCKYCPVGGRFSADMILDELEADKRFELRLRHPVRRIVFQNKRRAAGVEYLSIATGEVARAEADIVIVCAGAIETPKLLLASADRRFWPKGAGNDSGHVGRHLKAHQLLLASGVLPSNGRRMHQELDFPTLCSRHFDSPAEQRDGKMFFIRSRLPNLEIESRIIAGRTAKEIDLEAQGAMTVAVEGFVEPFSSPANAVALAAGTNRFGLPRTRVSFRQNESEQAKVKKNLSRFEGILRATGAHPVSSKIFVPRADHAASTCRMSRSDSDGVTDPDLNVHGTDNLYLCSNAVMPTVAAVNPTLTLVALAHRLVAKLW